ncbi:MAG: cystathionine beta-lyase [Salibacteraceae bacterium]|jgi:cystathionine beta-lyase
MVTRLNHNFDEPNDRFSTPAAKFKSEYLFELFGTDDLYPFWIADQDFKSPPAIVNALQKKATEGIFGYECKADDFKSIQVAWFKKRYKCDLKPDWILATPTIMSSLAMAIDLFTTTTASIIIQPPVYKEFKNTIQKTNRTSLNNPLKLVDLRYTMDFDQLKKITKQPNVEAIIISNPHNPGGRVWEKEELQELVTICYENKILIISDEIHADIVFQGKTFISLLAFPEIHNQLVVLYSPSKLFNIAAITDAMCIIPNLEMNNIFKQLLEKYNLGRPNAFSQVASTVGFTECEDWINDFNTYIESNVNYVSIFLEKHIPQLQLIQQDGTYLIWIDVSYLALQGADLVHYLAKEAKIGVNNGSVFGIEGAGFIRMSIACPIAIVETAMNNLKIAVFKLQKES